MPSAIRIRRARPTDRRAVAAICRATWDDDYLLDVFADWVRDRQGGLWVAVLEDRVVGVAKLSLVGDREAWLHGLRVHADFRRRGVARALQEHRLARARRLGARVARLDTSSDNLPILRLMRRFGFRERGRHPFFTARARAGTPPRRARTAELAALWRLARDGGALFAEDYVRRRVTRDDVARAIRAGRCVAVGPVGRPAAMAIVTTYEDRLRLMYLAGRGRALGALLRALPAEAARMGERRVGVMLPSTRSRLARAAGYRKAWDGAMVLFERRLA